MCGIWGLIFKKGIINYSKAFEAFNTIKHRGPDNSNFSSRYIDNFQIMSGFHRLAIHDISVNGDQPFYLQLGNRTIISMINGEIYNYAYLVEKYGLKNILKSTSDCEIIQHIYHKVGLDAMIKDLDGEFVFCIIDISDITKIYLGRDRFGVRPLFYSYSNDGLGFSSEAKGLVNICSNIKQFEPATYNEYIINDNTIKETIFTYYDKDYKINYDNNDIRIILPQIKRALKNSVRMMIDSDRPIGALLSGGLDSSLVVSIVSKYLKKKEKVLRTFSIGIPGSTDKEFAKTVSEYCNTIHTHVEFTQQEFLDAVPTVIKMIETYDITTIRASVGQYLIGKWISENTNIKVLFIGDGSDEVACGYMYFHKAPSPEAAHNDAKKLLKEIHYFDVLRADRGIASNGLEARVPFLSKQFVDTYMNIHPELRIPVFDAQQQRVVEKWLLRKAFDNKKYLPDSILWRKKEAFSDGVSSEEKSWFCIIQENIKPYKNYDYPIIYLPPVSTESTYYRHVFDESYPNCETLVPHYWLPSWVITSEPSARTLNL